MFDRINVKFGFFNYDIFIVLEEFDFIRVFGLGILVVLFYGIVLGLMFFVNKVRKIL